MHFLQFIYTEGYPEEEVKVSLERLQAEWNGINKQIEELHKGILYQDAITDYFQELVRLEEKIRQEEEWLKTQSLQAQDLPLQAMNDSTKVSISY